MTFETDAFKNAAKAWAMPTRFKVILNFPNAGDNSASDYFYCKGASLPTRTIGKVEASFMGRKVGYAGDVTYDDWTVHIYNDIDFTIRRKIEKWMELMNAAVANTGKIKHPDYQRTLIIQQLEMEKETVIKEYYFHNCFPTNMDQIDLGYDMNDTLEEYSVTFSIDYWTTPDVRVL